MSLKAFSLSGLAARLCNMLGDLPNIYDDRSGKIYTGGLSADEKSFVRETSASLDADKRLTVAFTGAGKVFSEVDVCKLNRKRKAQGFGLIPVAMPASRFE